MFDAPTKQVVKALARYWCDNPFASDTADGIRRWWLPPIDGVLAQHVDRVLACLCDRGLIERLLTADGRTRFRRASDRYDAELRRLAESGESGEVHARGTD